MFRADLHVHSKYSRATSRECDPEHLSIWAQRKGLSVIATGDFTHPRWMEELKEKLVPAEPGLYRLTPAIERTVQSEVPAACHLPSRFVLTVEISTIYKKGARTRKVHHVVIAPDFATADRLVERLLRVGNLASDGRPILGLDSRHLLEMVLESGPHAYLVPAHIWTPWFSVLGSSSGFDSIEECYGDLTDHIFALETGLSSDPPMNWRVSKLDRYRLVSNSDAHSPKKLGREANCFECDLDYFAMREALRTGVGYGGTIEFFPEEGKYHLDGHRKCQIRFTPEETESKNGICPTCGSRLTIGVMHRVDELADRDESCAAPSTGGPFRALIPLCEILGEIESTGPDSKRVAALYERLITKIGPELSILQSIPVEELQNVGPGLLPEAITRLRRGEVIREAGFDGEYGVIRLFRDEDLRQRTKGEALFGTGCSDSPAPLRVARGARKRQPAKTELLPLENDASVAGVIAGPATADSVLGGLDEEQRAAVEMSAGPLLIVAGPGSGKTRTLTHRIAHLILGQGVRPEDCLALTFTRRAAGEMRERLCCLLEGRGDNVPVHTFHSLGLELLREHGAIVGVNPGFRVIDDRERVSIAARLLEVSESRARTFLKKLSEIRRQGAAFEDSEGLKSAAAYSSTLREQGLVDYDDLVALPVDLLEADATVRSSFHDKWVFVDEYQDIDPLQYRLVRLLAASGSHLCAIGDPDQSIYGFRGADARLFQRFTGDFPQARVVRLKSNYRSGSCIVEASAQLIAALSPDKLTTRVVAQDHRRIVVHEAPTERAEAEFIVSSVEEMLGGHGFFSLDSGRAKGNKDSGFGLSDFAVLYRTDLQSAALIEAFERSGLPYQKLSHEPLLQSESVRSLVSELAAKDGPIEERLQVAFDHAIAADPSRKPRLEASLRLLAPIARAHGDRVEDFLSELALTCEPDLFDPRAERVSLMTIHASKGLEFPVVFVAGLEDGLLPLRFAASTPADLDEERRLLYVAMTRARQRLVLCCAKKRLFRGTIRSGVPSPFLTEIKKELLERRRSQASRRPRSEGGTQLTLF